MPVDAVRRQQVGKELCNDTESVRLEAVDSLVVVCKGLFEQVGPHAVQLAESLSDLAVELLIGALLAGTFYNHSREFVFHTMRQVNPHKLMHTLLEASTALDGQVDGSAQADEVRVGLVLDIHCLDFLVFFIFR